MLANCNHKDSRHVDCTVQKVLQQRQHVSEQKADREPMVDDDLEKSTEIQKWSHIDCHVLILSFHETQALDTKVCAPISFQFNS